MFWMILVLLLNSKLNTANIHCKQHNFRKKELTPDDIENYCESDNDNYYQRYCQNPILYTYCICYDDGWNQVKNNTITSNFLDGQVLEKDQKLLKILYIDNNFVDEIDVNAFNHLGNLSELYLQNNNILAIGKGVFNILNNLKVLDISNNQVTGIESKSFFGLTILEKLNISHNKIQHISSDIFDSNLHSMLILDLSHNLISTIELIGISKNFYHIYDPVDDYSNINGVDRNVQLDLSYNKMKYFNFSQLNLNKLNLNNNNLDTLSDDLVYLTTIKELDLSNNRLSKFNHAPENIKYLNLSGNILQNLNISISNGSKIEVLDASHNLIKELEFNIFDNMADLTELYLENNDLTELSIGIFNNLKNLKNLSLSGNHLRQFELGTFTGLSNLLELDISNNSFSSIDYKAFHVLNNLLTLNIANNNLTTINPNDVLNHCEYISKIDLSDNPWNCESLLNFTTTLKKTRRHIEIIEGSTRNSKNHLGHGCQDMVTENPNKKINYENHIIKNKVDELERFLDYEFRNSSFFNFFENYRNHNIPSPTNLNALNEYFNKDFKNTSFYKSFNKNISISFPNKYDETFHNLTDTLKLLNLQLSNFSRTNVQNSDKKFTSYDLFNKSILNPLNLNLAKLSKSIDKISDQFDDDFKESFHQLLQTKSQNDNSAQILPKLPQINPEAKISSNISYAKLTSASEGNHDVGEKIEKLRSSFIGFMTILIAILLIALLLPVIKRFINPLTRKSNSINTSESIVDLALVNSIRHESLEETQ